MVEFDLNSDEWVEPRCQSAADLTHAQIQEELLARGKQATGFRDNDTTSLQAMFDKEHEVLKREYDERLAAHKNEIERLERELREKRENERMLREEKNALEMDPDVAFWISRVEANDVPRNTVFSLNSVTARALSRVLTTCSVIISLDLSNKSREQFIGDNTGVHLCKCLHTNGTLRSINLAWNRLGPRTAKAMGETLLMNTSLKNLNLEGNALTVIQNEDEDDVFRFAEGAAVNSSSKQQQKQNKQRKVVLDFSGFSALTTSLEHNTSLLILCLRKCSLHNEGGQMLADSLAKNRTLIAVEVSYSDMEASQRMKMKSALVRNVKARNEALETQKARDEAARLLQAEEEKKRKAEEKKKNDEAWLESEKDTRCLQALKAIEVQREKFLENEKAKWDAAQIQKHKDALAASKAKKKKKKKKKSKRS